MANDINKYDFFYGLSFLFKEFFYTCNLTSCSEYNYSLNTLIFYVVNYGSIYFFYVTLDIFRASKFVRLFSSCRSLMDGVPLIVKSNAINDSFTASNCFFRKHITYSPGLTFKPFLSITHSRSIIFLCI